MERTMKVTGKGNLSVRPDTTRVLITLNELFPTYEKAVLTKKFEDLGFAKSDLKTLDFSINPDYESYEEKGVWKRKLIGFRYNHRMKLEFPIDNKMLGKVFYALAHTQGSPEFRVQYLIADPEPVKNKLLAKAIDDAKEKAAILAEAAGVRLNEIVTIDYSWGTVEFASREYDYGVMSRSLKLEAADTNGYDIDIETDDIQTSDTVTVVWTIA